ncbi:MAG: DUF192 domain-containing protein [Acidobacteria bacterium]|jgi:uncharacterized protein|nr:DUF192 domain-containing protein [Acidobacteriota bacterium]
MRSWQVLTLLLAAAAPLVSCSQPTAIGTTANAGPATQRPTPQALTHLEQPPAAVLPDGTRIDLELAITPEEHERGLMYRPHLAPDRGMLFLFDKPVVPDFWMKNTWVPLDMVFLGDDGLVVDIADNVQPCRADPCPEYSPRAACIAVLEIAGGTAAAHGVVRGAHIRLSGVEQFEKNP